MVGNTFLSRYRDGMRWIGKDTASSNKQNWDIGIQGRKSLRHQPGDEIAQGGLEKIEFPAR